MTKANGLQTQALRMCVTENKLETESTRTTLHVRHCSSDKKSPDQC